MKIKFHQDVPSIPEGVFHKGGVVRSALVAHFLGGEIAPPRDLDLVGDLGDFEVDTDLEVEVQRSTEDLFSGEFTINQCYADSTGNVFYLPQCIEDIKKRVIVPTEGWCDEGWLCTRIAARAMLLSLRLGFKVDLGSKIDRLWEDGFNVAVTMAKAWSVGHAESLHRLLLDQMPGYNFEHWSEIVLSYDLYERAKIEASLSAGCNSREEYEIFLSIDKWELMAEELGY